MIREKIDATQERKIIIYSITSTEFLRSIVLHARLDLFRSPYAKTVFSWVSQYFKEFEKAPGADIQDIYVAHRAEVLAAGDNDAIQEFLQSLSDEYEKEIANVPYAVKQAKKWLSSRGLEQLQEKISMCLKTGDIENGENAVASYTRMQDVQVSGVNLFSCATELSQAFDEKEEFLYAFPGYLGHITGSFCRGDFAAYTAFAKRGKSHALLSNVNQALYYGNNVLFLSLEMPINQVLRREWMALTHSPKYDRSVKIPFFVAEGDNLFSVDYDTQDMKQVDYSETAYNAWMKDFQKYFKRGSLRIESMPSRSATVDDLRAYVANLEYYEHWVPDVIVIDYADLLTTKEKGETWQKLDDIWVRLRGFAMEKNICIVTASQAGRINANSDVTEEGISGGISKIAHVTKMMTINSTKLERANGIFRVEQLAERDDDFIYEQCYVLSCFSIGQFFLDSRPKSQVVLR